jgi:general secretion pathway protein K
MAAAHENAMKIDALAVAMKDDNSITPAAKALKLRSAALKLGEDAAARIDEAKPAIDLARRPRQAVTAEEFLERCQTRVVEQGIALIAVLWTLILLSIIAAALSLETRSSARIARNMADQAAARAAADAGIQRAILDLVALAGAQTHTGNKRTVLRFVAPAGGALEPAEFPSGGTAYDWPFANTMVHISVQDEVGKINLNEAPEAPLAALFGSVGVDPGKAQSLAAAIADFRDADNLTRPGGAEKDEYRAAGLAWGPKNAPFQAVEELQQVLGMTTDIYERVAPYLTLYSMVGRFNPTTTTGPMRGILRWAGFNSQYVASYPGFVYSIRAEAKGANGAVFVREARVQLIQQERIAVQILAWGQ